MKKSAPKLISTDRVTQLLASYGAHSDRWPEEERVAALALIEKSSELKQILQDAETLDEAMALPGYEQTKLPKTESKLVSRILNNLPDQEPIREKVKILQHNSWFGNVWQHSGLLATGIAMTMVIVILLQTQPSEQYDSPHSLAQIELDQWLWEDITDETQNIDDNILDFMALAGLEQFDENY